MCYPSESWSSPAEEGGPEGRQALQKQGTGVWPRARATSLGRELSRLEGEVRHLVWTKSMPCFSNTRFYGLVFSSVVARVLKL